MSNSKDSASEAFYDNQLKSPNLIRRWWHNGRRELIYSLVSKYYNSGFIADLGCGNCTWNYRKDFNVIGIDINKQSLIYAMQKGRISTQICSDVIHANLASGSISMLVSSEVMEHIPDTDKYLQEVFRLLADNGIFILTLPYDANISLWKPLFALQCFLKGFIQRDPYYIGKCGHIHHYNKRKLISRLSHSGFKIKEIGIYYGMTLYCVAYKENM